MEGVISWVCLVMGIITRNAELIIASGVFAVATQIELYRKKGGAE